MTCQRFSSKKQLIKKFDLPIGEVWVKNKQLFPSTSSWHVIGKKRCPSN